MLSKNEELINLNSDFILNSFIEIYFLCTKNSLLIVQWILIYWE